MRSRLGNSPARRVVCRGRNDGKAETYCKSERLFQHARAFPNDGFIDVERRMNKGNGFIRQLLGYIAVCWYLYGLRHVLREIAIGHRAPDAV